MPEQEYQHPMAWVISNIKNDDMIYILWSSLNEIGQANLNHFLGYYSEETRIKWNNAIRGLHRQEAAHDTSK